MTADVHVCVWAVLRFIAENPLTNKTVDGLAQALTVYVAATPRPERSRAWAHLWDTLADERQAIEQMFADADDFVSEAPQCPRALSTN